MSIWGRLFGAKRVREAPSTDEVVSVAMAVLDNAVPALEVQRGGDAVLDVRMGGGARLVWNLADVVRRAAHDPKWRDGVEGLAGDVAEQLRAERPKGGVKMTPRNVVVLVWPSWRLDAIGFDVVSRELVPGLDLFYGVRGGGRIRSIRPPELEASKLDLTALHRHAVENVGVSAKKLGIGPLAKGMAVLTNHVGHPSAASLLADHAAWTRLEKKHGPLLVGAPAPSRLFIAPDTKELRRMMSTLSRRAFDVEEETLTPELLRFDHGEWSLASSPHS